MNMPRFSWLTLLPFLLGILLCVSFVPHCQSAILGVDLGSEFIKIASVQPGKSFHIVLDEQAKRKVPAVISFDEGERFFGAAALQLAVKKPKETFQFILRLIGQTSLNSPVIQQLKASGFQYDLVELTDRNAIGIRFVEENGKELIFSVEELLAMLLQYIVKLGEADAQQSITDLVITVPPFYTQKERQAILDAAEIANINILSLINENTAAAIQYGIDRKYTNENDSHTVIFYNMGSSSTKVSLVTYTAYVQKENKFKTSKSNNKIIGQFETRATAYDETLGGNAFESIITEYLASEINIQMKKKDPSNAIDVHTNARVMAKIRVAADKAKIVLSANKETPVSLVSLYNDVDYKITITRDKFYELSAQLLSRVSTPLKSVLDESGLTSKQIDSVLIIGGGVRIPGIQAEIKKVLKREDLGQNLNGDECFALGALFRAANLSTAFQVRQFGVNDLTPFGVGVKLIELQHEDNVLESIANEKDRKSAAATPASDSEEEKDDESLQISEQLNKRASLFKRYNRLNKRKMVAFSHTRDFSAYLYHDDKYFPSSVFHPAIAHYNITGLSDLMSDPKNEQLLAQQKPKVSLSFLLDNSGIASLTKAEATLEETVKVAVTKPKAKKIEDKITVTKDENATEGTTPTEEGNTSEGKENKADDEPTADSASASAAPDKSSETSASTADGEALGSDLTNSTSNSTVEEELEIEYVNKKKIHTFPLRLTRGEISSTFIPLNSSSILQSRQRLTFFQKRDEMRREIQAAKNSLESFIYASRNELYDDEYQAVSTEEQREEIKNVCDQTESWLYEPKPENDKESLSIYKSKLGDLKKLVEPIKLRISEQHERPQALNTSKTLLEFAKKQIDEYREKRPWVKVEDLDKQAKLIEEAESWLNTKEEEQNAKAPHEALAVTSTEILMKLKPIAKLSQELMQQKKPVEKKEKKDTKKENATDSTSTEEDQKGKEQDAGKEQSSEQKTDDQTTTDNEAEQTESESQSQNIPHEHPDL